MDRRNDSPKGVSALSSSWTFPESKISGILIGTQTCPVDPLFLSTSSNLAMGVELSMNIGLQSNTPSQNVRSAIYRVA
jgi:hypothetical protein